MCGRRALRSRFAACIGRPGRARLGRGARECGGLTDAHGVFVSRRVEMPSCRRAAVPPCCPRLAPRASRLAPRASRLAPRASRLAPRASR
ncbi:NADP-dependent oxidoreductase, partial [Burkholderia pseudomallei]|nr:NADP-dependent oxidoreductase [Burkholderia pseudomallei]